MDAQTFERLRVQAPMEILSLLDLNMNIQPNHHGIITIRGFVSSDEQFKSVEQPLTGEMLSIRELDENGNVLNEPVFRGIIRSSSITEINEHYVAEVTALSATCLLDQKKKSRSFQEVTMSYADVVSAILAETLDAAAIFPEGKNRTIDKPLIQYEETDWQFIKRLASHFNSALIPDCRVGNPFFWFGMRENGEPCNFSENEYEFKIDQKFFDMGGKEAGWRKSDFSFYQVRSISDYRIGDQTTFKNHSLLICEKYGCMERGEIVYTYKLGPKPLIGDREYYNENLTGISLEGNVEKTDHELVNIHLDIDAERSDPTYPYYWVPTSGNLMYCMPKLGTRASLLISSHDEREARAMNSPRLNGSSDPGMADYNNRYLTTEHNKRMFLFPDSMGIIGTSGTEVPLRIVLDDENFLLLEDHKDAELIAYADITFEAPNVTVEVPVEIRILRDATGGAQAIAQIVPKGTGTRSNPPTGGGDTTYFTAANLVNASGEIAKLCGTTFETYEPFQDAPEEGTDWFVIVTSIIVAVTAVVAIALVGAMIGIIACGLVAAVGCTAATAVITGAAIKFMATVSIGAGISILINGTLKMHDILKENNYCIQDIEWNEFFKTSTYSGLSGAFTGGAWGLGTSITANIIFTLISDLDQKKSWDEIAFDLVAAGIGGRLAGTGLMHDIGADDIVGDMIGKEALKQAIHDSIVGGGMGAFAGNYGGGILKSIFNAFDNILKESTKMQIEAQTEIVKAQSASLENTMDAWREDRHRQFEANIAVSKAQSEILSDWTEAIANNIAESWQEISKCVDEALQKAEESFNSFVEEISEPFEEYKQRMVEEAIKRVMNGLR